MERINDGRRNLIIHGNATVNDLPLKGLGELPPIADSGGFVPSNMSEPKLYPGDVLVGLNDGRIEFAELVYNNLENGVMLFDFDTGRHTLMGDQEFGARFYQTDEIHIYDDITREQPDSSVEFDESQVERPDAGRAR